MSSCGHAPRPISRCGKDALALPIQNYNSGTLVPPCSLPCAYNGASPNLGAL